jgi:hypothetical protein
MPCHAVTPTATTTAVGNHSNVTSVPPASPAQVTERSPVFCVNANNSRTHMCQSCRGQTSASTAIRSCTTHRNTASELRRRLGDRHNTTAAHLVSRFATTLRCISSTHCTQEDEESQAMSERPRTPSHATLLHHNQRAATHRWLDELRVQRRVRVADCRFEHALSHKP